MREDETGPVSERSSEQAPAAAAGPIMLGDLTVNRIGFGAMRLPYGDVDRARSLLHRALELGVNLIDTADVYGGMTNESLIAEALYPYPRELVIATKGGQVAIDGKAAPDCRPEHLREACEGSLRRLRLPVIDLYQLHNPDPAVPLEEALGALVELRAEGKIRHIGVSNLFGEQFERALEAAPVVSLQNRYSVGDRVTERDVEACGRHGLAFMPWAPLGAGSLAEPASEIGRVAAHRGATAVQVALAWLLRRTPMMLPIPGTSSIEHLEENVAAAQLRLSDDEFQRLANAFKAD